MTASPDALIVRAKLGMPRPAGRLVPRPRLLVRFGDGRLPPLTLICAPAGFGKTTLVGQLSALRDCPVAWYSIDRRDSDPQRFMAHLIAAVAEAVPGFGANHLQKVVRRESGADEGDIFRFANAVANLPHPLTLVLDDYHELDSPDAHALVAALLDHQPQSLSVVMTSRRDPPLPLARLRARGRIVDIREDDLRFSDQEAHCFVNEGLTIGLSEALAVKLNSKTEGWVAGLQLAGLSLRHSADVAERIAEFDSRDRFITDYLTEEVLQRQPEEVRRFLLATSILERITAPLAAAVSGVPDAQAMLERLEREHLFIFALDHRGESFRYHPLFAGLLRHQLSLQDGKLTGAYRARASDWFAAQGLLDDAVTQAMAIPDGERVGRLLEREGWRLIAGMQARTVAGWAAEAGPDAMRGNLDRMVIGWVANLLIGGDIDESLVNLAQERAGADQSPNSGYPHAVAWIKGIALAKRKCYADAAQVLGGLRAEPGAVGAFLSAVPVYCRYTASYWRREFDSAVPVLREAMSFSLEKDVGAGYFPAAVALAEIYRSWGDYAQADELIDRCCKEAESRGWSETVGMGWLRLAQGELHYATNDLSAADTCYAQAFDLTRFAGSNTVPRLARMRRAMVAHVRGEHAAALELAHELAHLPHRANPSFILSVHDRMCARMWRVLEQQAAAGEVFRALGIAMTDDPIDPAREEEYVELAHWHISRGEGASTLALLRRLTAAAERGGRRRVAAEFLLLQALAQQQQGDLRQADTALLSALELAGPTRDKRMFLDAGAALVTLLGRIRDNVQLTPAAAALQQELVAATATDSRPHDAPTEALSRKELAVLRLLATGRSNEEIAANTFVSANTVKTHLRHIYAKLNVNSRSGAIRRAAEWGLLDD